MKIDVLLGLQWGDEGKGKIVDVLTPNYDVIVRFQGGPNAGHSLEFNGMRHILHTIPSGIFHPQTINVIGNGVVIDPIIFRKEIVALEKMGINPRNNLKMSKKAHFILPTHKILDAASEAAKGVSKIGSTLKGIGPCYMDKTGRNGLRVGDILLPNFIDKYNTLVDKHLQLLKMYDYSFNYKENEQEWLDCIEFLKTFELIDSEYYINSLINSDKKILAEGAQGTLLDIDFGSYPFVTSSNTITAGVCTGIGVAPNKIGEVYGIFKAYCTRVGSGPFPTELLDEMGEKLRKNGNEYGSTTGRPRRCGWLDIPTLKYSTMLNGVTQLIVTKPDVMNDFPLIKVATQYRNRLDNSTFDILPYDITTVDFEPVYRDFQGWETGLETNEFGKLPIKFLEYIQFVESQLNIPVTIVSTGPDRTQTILR